MKSYDKIIVEIDQDIIDRFEALEEPKQVTGWWTPEREALLMKYWPIKRHAEVAKLLGKSDTTCRRKYEQLVARR